MIEAGDTVAVHYALALDDGQEIESTFDESPRVFTFADGEMPAAMEQRLGALSVGEETAFVIAADEHAFGAHDPSNRHHLERAAFDADHCRPGALVEFELPSGDTVAGRIESVDESGVLVDFNHPLAGRNVHCRLQLVSVEQHGTST